MFSLPPLTYPYDALEPVIDAETVRIHHDVNHAAYVRNLNLALEDAGLSHVHDIWSLLSPANPYELPYTPFIPIEDQVVDPVTRAIIFNGSAHLNHRLGWHWVSPLGGAPPEGALAGAIFDEWGGLDGLFDEMMERGTSLLGSGWVWLVSSPEGLWVCTMQNQDTPWNVVGARPILGIDLWEHAYLGRCQVCMLP